MAARPGEELVANLYADIHYFLGPPAAKPPHHRFDRGSYVYIFEHAAERRARLEIANQAGTPDQDALNGPLANSHIEYSYKHTNLITLAVDFAPGGTPSASPESREWRLPAFDERNETKYLYKLHTIDLYFRTQEDALLFLNSVRRILPYTQVTVRDEPPHTPAPSGDMSPVVQKLESVAITDPSYQHGQTRDSRGAVSFPGPPSVAPPQQSQQNPAAFTPMAYNPAAPPAPEVIAHREKTPPPEDGGANPLAIAVASDQGVPQFHQSPPQMMGQPPGSYFPGPPQSAGLNSPYHQPFPSAGLQSPYQTQLPGSFPPPPPPPPSGSAANNQQPSVAPQLSQEQIPNTKSAPPQYPSFSDPPGVSPPMQSPPPGGYSPYSYAQNPQQATQDYSIHQQVYRPTEGEAANKFHGPPKEPKGKLEIKADKAEKKVTGFLKKMEKKFL